MESRVLALLALLPLSALAQGFQQGPERIGAVEHLEGRVLGVHDACALVLADTQREGWEGLGGGGRFYYCADGLVPGATVNVDAVQVGTRWARVGPRWRVVPVYR